MAKKIEFDVTVLGAGPAGATAARWLAIRGYRVCMLDRAPPRPTDRLETLSPGAVELLRLHHCDFLPKLVHRFAPCYGTVLWKQSDDVASIVPAGVLVRRNAIDRMLRDSATSSGVCRRDIVGDPPSIATGPAGWTISYQGPTATLIRSRFLIDATGRSSSLYGLRSALGPRTLAVTARVTGTCIEPHNTRVEALADGWLWAGCDDGRNATVTLFIAPHTRRKWPIRDHSNAFLRFVRNSSLVAGNKNVATDSNINVRDATVTAQNSSGENDLFRVGDAAIALDPISGQGFQRALVSSVQAAIVINTIHASNKSASLARTFYSDSHNHSIREHVAACRTFYQRQDRFDTPFWRERSGDGPSLDTTVTNDFDKSLHQKLRISPHATWRDTPVIEGELVVCRTALVHPSLRRPIAYLEGQLVSKLLGPHPKDCTEADFFRNWDADATLKPASPLRALKFLFNRGILQPIERT